jgi:hypothetical protein
MVNARLTGTMARPEFSRPTSAVQAAALIVATLAYYEQCQERHLDKVLEHAEQEKEVAGSYVLAKDLAYGAKLCTKDARTEFVKTVLLSPDDLDATERGGNIEAAKAMHAIVGYQGGARLLETLVEEMRHTETELAQARRAHDSAMMIGAIFAGCDTIIDEGRVTVDAGTVAPRATAKRAGTKKR